MRIFLFLLTIPLFFSHGSWETDIESAGTLEQLQALRQKASLTLKGKGNIKTLKKVQRLIAIRESEIKGSDIVARRSDGSAITADHVRQQIARSSPQKSPSSAVYARNVGTPGGVQLSQGELVVKPDGTGAFMDQAGNRYTPDGRKLPSSSSADQVVTRISGGKLRAADGTIYTPESHSSSAPAPKETRGRSPSRSSSSVTRGNSPSKSSASTRGRSPSRSSSSVTRGNSPSKSSASKPRSRTPSPPRLSKDEMALDRILKMGIGELGEPKEILFQEILEYFLGYYKACAEGLDCESESGKWFLNFKAGTTSSQISTEIIFRMIQKFSAIHTGEKIEKLKKAAHLKMFSAINNAPQATLNEFFRRHAAQGEKSLISSLATLHEKLLSLPPGRQQAFLKDPSENGILSLIKNPDQNRKQDKSKTHSAKLTRKDIEKEFFKLPQIPLTSDAFSKKGLQEGYRTIPDTLLNSNLFAPLRKAFLILPDSYTGPQKNSQVAILRRCLNDLVSTFIKPLQKHTSDLKEKDKQLEKNRDIQANKRTLARLKSKPDQSDDDLKAKITELEQKVQAAEARIFAGFDKNPLITLGKWDTKAETHAKIVEAAQKQYKAEGDALKRRAAAPKSAPAFAKGSVPPPPPPPPGTQGSAPPPPPPLPGMLAAPGMGGGRKLDPLTAYEMTRTYEEWLEFVPSENQKTQELYAKILHHVLVNDKGEVACIAPNPKAAARKGKPGSPKAARAASRPGSPKAGLRRGSSGPSSNAQGDPKASDFRAHLRPGALKDEPKDQIHVRHRDFREALRKNANAKSSEEIIEHYLRLVPFFVLEVKKDLSGSNYITDNHNESIDIANAAFPAQKRTAINLLISEVQLNWKNYSSQKVNDTLKQAIKDFKQSAKTTTEDALKSKDLGKVPAYVVLTDDELRPSQFTIDRDSRELKVEKKLTNDEIREKHKLAIQEFIKMIKALPKNLP